MFQDNSNECLVVELSKYMYNMLKAKIDRLAGKIDFLQRTPL